MLGLRNAVPGDPFFFCHRFCTDRIDRMLIDTRRVDRNQHRLFETDGGLLHRGEVHYACGGWGNEIGFQCVMLFGKGWCLGSSPVKFALGEKGGRTGADSQRFPIVNFINFESARNASVEALADHKVQAVSYWQIPDKIEKLSEAGIPTLVGMAANLDRVASVDAYVNYRCKEIEMYSSVFGGDALEKGRDWIKYFKEKVDFIYSRTKSLPDSARPSVYYVRGPDVLTTHGIYTYTWWHIIIAGGRPMTPKNTKEPVSHITPERFLIWDPDFIFMGWLSSKTPFTDDPKWSQLQAVKNDKIFVDPKGFNDWDYSSEAPLLILFFAKTIHRNCLPTSI